MINHLIKKISSGLKLVTGLGTGVVFGNITSAFIPNCCLPIKVSAYIGSYILSMMLSEKTDEYIDRKAEEYEKEIEELKATIDEVGQNA